jgi:hypothetical protein
MVHREQPLSSRLKPAVLRDRLTLRAMPIAAGVVRGTLVAAVTADVEVAPEFRGPAERDRAQDAALLEA